MGNVYRMMVVDDERIVREAIASHIRWEDHGITVVKTAANAVEALEYFQENPVDLILTDIKMPVMDGIALLKRVKALREDVDFIILSGYADFAYAQEAIRYGAKDYLLKPLDEAALVNVVLKCKNDREGRQFLSSLWQNPALSRILPKKEQGSRYSQTIQKILQVVQEEISNEELSLKWISAQKLFLNENYLSKVFQKEVGQKFSAYLLDRRMMLAMEMLARDGDALILDVARAAGFGENSQYFSSSFKKYTGYTPTEYKKYIKEAKDK